jgi:uncharacterized phage protein gp47/JayE
MRSQIAARVTDISALAPRGIIDVMTTAVAGAVYTIHGYIEYMLRQILPDTATGKYLERHGAMWGVATSGARRAMGVVWADLGIALGTTIHAGTILTSESGREYETLQGNTLGYYALLVAALNPGKDGNLKGGDRLYFRSPVDGAPESVEVIGISGIDSVTGGFVIAHGVAGATIDQGAELIDEFSNIYAVIIRASLSDDGYVAVYVQGQQGCPPGTPLTFTDPPAGIDPIAIVADAGIYGGADEQTEQEYRQSILARMRQPPQGGSMADYRRWVRESPGVRAKNVWVFGHPDTAPGTVEVYFTTLDGLPSGADVIAAQGYIEHMKPVGTRVTVSVPKTKDIDITISTLIAPGYDRLDVVEQIRQEIVAEFADYEMQSTPHTMPISVIYRALAQVAGLKKYAITSITGGGSQGVDMPAFTLPVLGVLDA